MKAFERGYKRVGGHVFDAVTKYVAGWRGDCGGFLKSDQEIYNAVKDLDVSYKYDEVSTEDKSELDPNYDPDDEDSAEV